MPCIAWRDGYTIQSIISTQTKTNIGQPGPTRWKRRRKDLSTTWGWDEKGDKPIWGVTSPISNI